jgi:hypothetical protein
MNFPKVTHENAGAREIKDFRGMAVPDLSHSLKLRPDMRAVRRGDARASKAVEKPGHIRDATILAIIE